MAVAEGSAEGRILLKHWWKPPRARVKRVERSEDLQEWLRKNPNTVIIFWVSPFDC